MQIHCSEIGEISEQVNHFKLKICSTTSLKILDLMAAKFNLHELWKYYPHESVIGTEYFVNEDPLVLGKIYEYLKFLLMITLSIISL